MAREGKAGGGRVSIGSSFVVCVISGFSAGKKKFDQNNSYETVYRENVPEKPLRTHYDKPSSIISDSSIATMGIFP